MPTIKCAPIPVTVIGGFLGTGKTTYLNRLIQGGLRPDALIIVNDFGDINIDAALIEYRDDNVMQLSNGCICCTLGGTLAEQLAEALRIRTEPGAIIIEASGVANPARIADIARVSRRLHLAEVVCIIDGSRAQQHAADPLVGDAWRDQVKAADTLRVNRLAPHGTREFEQWLRQFNPHALIQYETEGTPADASLQPPISPSPPGPISHHAAPHGHWHTFSLSGQEKIDKARLATLLEAYQDVLFRAKGFMLVEPSGDIELLQFSGGRLHWQPALHAPKETRLVFIGLSGERFSAFEQAVRLLLKDSL
ncbi:GTP-binding protein [Halomonas piscis]|uniref:GTP-binding protein n=1 Tax=Halomonas piscis TaxID=3031727 RepID=A0ABY9YZK6_9GAMM|nr:GTP-binding protein [Halomonas piscis]WNK19765.1 GTP-binding protein [Halomonas piscis]